MLIEEVINKDAVKTYWQAMREVQEEEQFQTYEEDRTRLAALKATPEAERDEEEYTELSNHLHKYAEKVRETIANITKPVREALEEHDMDKLVEIVTEDRIQAEALQEFEDVYSQWEWFIGTMRLQSKEKSGHPSERYFGDVEALKAAPPEVISGLAETFTELDAEAGRSLGNS
jgi:hypothetical protein